MSSRVSKSTYRNSAAGTSIATAEMTYRRLSFEDELFTAIAYKRNYRNPRIDHLFNTRRSRLLKPESSPATRIRSTAPSVDGEALHLNTNESLQVHAQKEFTKEQAKQSYISDLESRKNDNDRAFLKACRSGDAQLVESRLKYPRTNGTKNVIPKSLMLEALKDAILAGHHNVVRRLLNMIITIDHQLSQTGGWLPLQFAAHKGDVAMTRLLLEAGADVSPTGSGTKPIHIASHRGSVEITSMLVSAGAAIDADDNHGFQPIHLASTYAERAAQIALLVSAGAKVDAVNSSAPSWQKYPLQLACLTGQRANVCALLELGATKDIGRSLLDAPLGIAIRQRHVEIVQTLLEHGADPNYASKSKSNSLFAAQIGGPGMTPLSLLAKNFGDRRTKSAFDQAMLDLLLEHGADVHSKDDMGNQVLHYVCSSPSSVNLDFRNDASHEKLVSTLLGQDIDINATNDNGECPLYLAAANCNRQLVSLLLVNGARRLSSAELFRLHKIMERLEKRRPGMQEDTKELMRLLGPGREGRMRETVSRRSPKVSDAKMPAPGFG